MPTIDSGENKRKALALDRSDWMAILAVIISMGAFFVSVYEANIMKEQQAIMQSQQKASVWPYLESSIKMSVDSSYSTFSVGIKNKGVGPARINSFSFIVNDTYITDYNSLREELDRSLITKGKNIGYSYSPPRGVISANDSKEILRIKQKIGGLDFLEIGKVDFSFEICFCSIYGDCWTLNEDDAEPKPGCLE